MLGRVYSHCLDLFLQHLQYLIAFLLDTGSVLAVQRNAEGALQRSITSVDLFFWVFKPEVGMSLSCYSWRILQRGFSTLPHSNKVSRSWAGHPYMYGCPAEGHNPKQHHGSSFFCQQNKKLIQSGQATTEAWKGGIQSAQELRKIWQFSHGCKN